MRASRICCFARVSRLAIAASEVRNARAISPGLKPQRVLSASATCISCGMSEWQHVNIMRKRSSLI